MAAVTTPSPGDAAKVVGDWCTLADAGGFDVNLSPIPFAFRTTTAGTVQIQGRSANSMPVTLLADEQVDYRVRKFVSGGSTTLTDTQIWVLY